MVVAYPVEAEIDGGLVPHKAAMVADAVERYGLRSVMDVGACWRVNGGYGLHALAAGAERVALLDGDITRLTRVRAAGDPRVSLHEGSLGDQGFIDALPRCDAAIVFDVLLHQVAPDWHEFLARYAAKVDHFIVYNQDFAETSTFRLPDRGAEWYMANTPERDRARVLGWFGRHDREVPWLGRPWRDAHHFWQWGITRGDLIECMERLGFGLDWSHDFGPWSDDLPHIRIDGFLFSRK